MAADPKVATRNGAPTILDACRESEDGGSCAILAGALRGLGKPSRDDQASLAEFARRNSFKPLKWADPEWADTNFKPVAKAAWNSDGEPLCTWIEQGRSLDDVAEFFGVSHSTKIPERAIADQESPEFERENVGWIVAAVEFYQPTENQPNRMKLTHRIGSQASFTACARVLVGDICEAFGNDPAKLFKAIEADRRDEAERVFAYEMNWIRGSAGRGRNFSWQKK